MHTFKYKGWWIHENFTANEVTFQSPSHDVRPAKSVHAAKCLITRLKRLIGSQRTMGDNGAMMDGFTVEIAGSLLVKPDTDTTRNFVAWDLEKQEYTMVCVNGVKVKIGVDLPD